MNLIHICARYPTQDTCIEHLEDVRWGDNPHCPHCGSGHVARKADGNRVGRWNCHDCHASFNVLAGTIMEGTRVPLQKWFLAIGLMVNAKKSLSSCQLARDLDLNQKTAWYMQQRIRSQMASDQGSILLQGIVEADETYVGGKPRKANKREDDEPAPRGRGTSKTPVIGVVERGGKVVAQVADSLKGKAVVKFLRSAVIPEGSVLITDEFKAYNAMQGILPRMTINHDVQYVDGMIHTNTIEGVWALLKRAWFGSHHHYSKQWMPLFVAEAAWKYNQRHSGNAFGAFLKAVVS